MDCNIYKGNRKQDHYLFTSSKDELTAVPSDILKMFGEVEFVMQLVITPDTRLANSRPQDILEMIEEKGFFIQLPPENEYQI